MSNVTNNVLGQPDLLDLIAGYLSNTRLNEVCSAIKVSSNVEEKVCKQAINLLEGVGGVPYPRIPPVLTFKQQVRRFYAEWLPAQAARLQALEDHAVIQRAAPSGDAAQDIADFFIREDQIGALERVNGAIPELRKEALSTFIVLLVASAVFAGMSWLEGANAAECYAQALDSCEKFSATQNVHMLFSQIAALGSLCRPAALTVVFAYEHSRFGLRILARRVRNLLPF
jgi:hypothetical protein